MSAYDEGKQAARIGWLLDLLPILDLTLGRRILGRIGSWRGSRGGL